MTSSKEEAGLPLTAARWRIESAKVPAAGLDLELSASEDELKTLSSALELIALESFTLSGRLDPLSRGRFRLDALLSAKAVQRCVATLEPVDALIEEEIDIELAPPEAIGEPKRQIDIDPDADVPEQIEDGFLPVGRLAYETLSVALPPYPRSAAAIEADASVLDDRPASPFAVLKGLKKPV
jgi:uncharacterized metal-binding protein YceD (DUF177 family)